MYNDKIDVQKGISYLAGKEEIYKKIVSIFVKSAENKIDELKTFYAQGDFKRLTIEFHGLKSSAATVGSTLLPELAQKLEAAGKSEDTSFIKENFNALIAQYEDTCLALQGAAAQL